jgi:hypothetical protein
MLLALISAVILRSESLGTHGHILLSQIRDFPNLKGQTLGSLFVASYDSQGYGGGIRPRPRTEFDNACLIHYSYLITSDQAMSEGDNRKI